MKIPYGPWNPANKQYEAETVVEAKNVLPAAGGGYRPWLDYNRYDTEPTPVSFYPSIIFSAPLTDGTPLNVVGSSAAIHELDGTALNDLTTSVSPSAGSGAGQQGWDMALCGDELIATYDDQPPLTASLDASGSQQFALLTVTDGPTGGAHCVGCVKDFLVFGWTKEGGVKYPRRVRWSGFQNATTWGTDPSTQADFQDLNTEYGPIEKIIPGEVGYILCRKAVVRMTYVGPPTVFRFDRVKAIGCWSRKSVCFNDDYVFWWGRSGFFRMDLATEAIVPIGHDVIDEWAAEKFGNQVYDSWGPPIQGAIDQNEKTVYFAINGQNISADSNYGECLAYDWVENRWSYADTTDLSAVGTIIIPSSSDEADGINQTLALTRTIFSGGFETTFGFFDGTELAPEITTGDFGSDGELIYIDGARPIVERGSGNITTLTARCSYRLNELQDAEDGNTGDVAVNDIGRSDFRVSARYANFTVKSTGSFRRHIGIEFDPQPDGER